MTTIRPQVFAGSFYPEDEQELKEIISKYLRKAKPPVVKGEIKALISPHAGFIYSGPTAAYGYKLIKNKKYKNVILLGPSHKMMFQNIALSNFAFWKTPLGNILCSPLYKELNDKYDFQLLNEVHAFEHSLEVQLPFLQTVLKDFKITPLVTGRVGNHKEIAEQIKEYIDDKTLIIVSSDLSHYLPYKQANTTDKKTIKQILELDIEIDREQACGADGIIILIELAKLCNWKVKLLDYRNSGDTAADKNQVVGYTSIVFYKSASR